MKYKAIGFDYGGVIGGVGTTGNNFSDMARLLLGVSEDTFAETYFGMNHKINLGEVATWREFWTEFLDKLGQPEKLDELMVLSDESSRNLLVIDYDMLALVDKLRQSGFKVGLLSNTTLEGARYMREQNLDSHFDAFNASAEIKLMKPNPEAFAKLARELGVQLDELIFIDDSEKSLSTAKECGFTPILFISRDELLKQLQLLGIHA